MLAPKTINHITVFVSRGSRGFTKSFKSAHDASLFIDRLLAQDPALGIFLSGAIATRLDEGLPNQ